MTQDGNWGSWSILTSERARIVIESKYWGILSYLQMAFQSLLCNFNLQCTLCYASIHLLLCLTELVLCYVQSLSFCSFKKQHNETGLEWIYTFGWEDVCHITIECSKCRHFSCCYHPRGTHPEGIERQTKFLLAGKAAFWHRDTQMMGHASKKRERQILSYLLGSTGQTLARPTFGGPIRDRYPVHV